MTARHRVSSGSPYEEPIGFSRAVRVGGQRFKPGRSNYRSAALYLDAKLRPRRKYAVTVDAGLAETTDDGGQPLVGHNLAAVIEEMENRMRAAAADSPAPYTADWESVANHKPAPDWFRDAKFGIFIHWGLYAIPAGTWKGKRIPGIGEWTAQYVAMRALKNPDAFPASPIKLLPREVYPLPSMSGVPVLPATIVFLRLAVPPSRRMPRRSLAMAATSRPCSREPGRSSPEPSTRPAVAARGRW